MWIKDALGHAIESWSIERGGDVPYRLEDEEGLSIKGNVSKEVLENLDTLADTMLDRLPQKLLPKREVNH